MENQIDLNTLAQRVHQANIKWWQDPVTKQPIERNKGELLMLVITELAEACEGERKNLMDDKLPHRRMAEVEMADALIRLLDFAAGFNIQIMPHSTLGVNAKLINKGAFLLSICNLICRIEYPDDINIYDNLSVSIKFITIYCERFGYDLMGAFEEKMKYNETREDHKHEARLQAGGKQW